MKNIIVLIYVLFTPVSCLDWPCVKEKGDEFKGDIAECRAYFFCHDGTATKFLCPPKSVYYEAGGSCVPEDYSPDINCANGPTPFEHLYCDTNSTDQVSDPKSCARYFDCGAPKPGQFEDPFLRECPYPELWSPEDQECVNSSYTDCGDRPVPIDKSEYLSHQCLAAGCVTCRSRYSSCRGLRDGLDAWPGMKGSSRYIYCINQRLLHIGFCKIHFENQQDSIPKKKGANGPTAFEHLYCDTNSTDQVSDPKSCARYFDCGALKPGQFEDPFLRECPYPELWSPEDQECVNSSYTGCGDRPVPIDKCEYLSHQCLTARCTPCRSRYASCKGMGDGFNAWPGMEGSSRYIYCINQRLLHNGFCKIHYGKPTRFDPEKKKCVYAV